MAIWLKCGCWWTNTKEAIQKIFWTCSERIPTSGNGIYLEIPGSVGTCGDHALNSLKNGFLCKEELDKCLTHELWLKFLGKEFNSLNKCNMISIFVEEW